MKIIVSFAVVFISAMVGWLYSIYIGQFHQNSETTAVSGMLFRTTLNLNEYRNISSGNDVWGKFERYTRSDRHTETITVYCGKYCKQ